MAIRKDKQLKKWCVDITYKGKRYREVSPENSRDGARAYELVLRQKLARGKPISQLKEKPNEQEQKFEKFSKYWFNDFVKNNNKPSTISNKKYVLKNQLVPFFGRTPINQISTGQVERFKAEKRGRITEKTINNYLEVLKTCLNVAKELLDLDRIPKIKKLKEPPVDFDFLTQGESDSLLSSMTGVWREIVLTAIKTGLRMGELRGLKWQDIDCNNQTLTVNHSWCNYNKGLVSPKSNKIRNIPLTSEVFDVLSRGGKKSEFVFLDEFDGMFNDQRFNCELEEACKRAGLRKVTCHTLRHTFASHLAMSGAPIVSIQQLMGHADIKTTMRYAHLSQSSLKSTIDLLEPKSKNSNFSQYTVNPINDKLESPEGVRAF